MRGRVVLLALACALALSGCSSGGKSSTKSTSTTSPDEDLTASTATTRPPVTSPGRPRTTTTVPVDISPGPARISGTVVGPDGAVADATVRVERLVGSQVATVNLTAAGGQFNLPSIRGGTYRVRAWRAPDFVQPQAEVFFLGSDEIKTLELRLVRVSELSVQTTVDPNPPPPQDPFTVTVLVYTGSVTPDGLLQAVARPGQPVLLMPGAGLALQGNDRGTTDGSGKISFRIRCTAAGQANADVLVNATRLPLSLPACPSA